MLACRLLPVEAEGMSGDAGSIYIVCLETVFADRKLFTVMNLSQAFDALLAHDSMRCGSFLVRCAAGSRWMVVGTALASRCPSKTRSAARAALPRREMDDLDQVSPM